MFFIDPMLQISLFLRGNQGKKNLIRGLTKQTKKQIHTTFEQQPDVDV